MSSCSMTDPKRYLATSDSVIKTDQVKTSELVHEIPALRVKSGMLLAPKNQKCERLRIYFPGYAQELGKKHTLTSSREQKKWISYLVGPGNYHLGPKIQEKGCPILMLNDSYTSPDNDELNDIMEKAGATEIEILSHSGGYLGLQKALITWDKSNIDAVTSLLMLDNFYDPGLIKTLEKKLGAQNLQNICGGFSTDGRGLSFLTICPQIQIDKDVSVPKKGSNNTIDKSQDFTHKGSVKLFF